MEKEALKELFNQLREEDVEELDNETRSLLYKLHDEIEVMLELSSEAPRENVDRVEQGLKESIERFEGEHPALTEGLSRFLDVLVSIGL